MVLVKSFLFLLFILIFAYWYNKTFQSKEGFSEKDQLATLKIHVNDLLKLNKKAIKIKNTF